MTLVLHLLLLLFMVGQKGIQFLVTLPRNDLSIGHTVHDIPEHLLESFTVFVFGVLKDYYLLGGVLELFSLLEDAIVVVTMFVPEELEVSPFRLGHLQLDILDSKAILKGV